jgi:hypothetical protein
VISLEDSSFVNNSAGVDGGALSLVGDNNSVVVDNCTFVGNDAVSDGGAIGNNGSDNNINISDSNFNNNSANSGVISSEGNNNSINVDGSDFENNKGKDVIDTSGDNNAVKVDNSTFTNNNVTDLVADKGKNNSMDLKNSKNTHNTITQIKVTSNKKTYKFTITATVVDKYDNKPISGITVSFYVNGKKVGSAKTNSKGVATYIYTPTKNGKHTFRTGVTNTTITTNSGIHIYKSSSASRTVTIKIPNFVTKIVYLYRHAKVGRIIKNLYVIGNLGRKIGSKSLYIKVPKNGKVFYLANNKLAYTKFNSKISVLRITARNLSYFDHKWKNIAIVYYKYRLR